MKPKFKIGDVCVFYNRHQNTRIFVKILCVNGQANYTVEALQQNVKYEPFLAFEAELKTCAEMIMQLWEEYSYYYTRLVLWKDMSLK